ncbi:MAG: dienelactone hydrolase family protein [Myxococcota bacterium]
MSAEELEIGHLVTAGDAPAPGVVMIHDVWGLSDHTRDLAGRLAGEGFAVLAVDLYRKIGQPRISDPASAMAWIRDLPDPVILETLQEAIDFLGDHPSTGGRKVGLTGFCMGGQYTLLGACSCRGLTAAVAYYGMLLNAPDADPERKPRSPLDAVAELSVPLLGLFGEDDLLIPVAQVRELEGRLRQSGGDCDVVLYAGAGHAFMNDTRPELYRPEAARDAWGRMVSFFRQHLS